MFQAHGKSVTSIKSLSRQVVARKFKIAGDILGVSLSTHSMRKTRGYHMMKNGAAITDVMKVLNHSSPAVTLAYIGITQDDINATYDDLVL